MESPEVNFEVCDPFKLKNRKKEFEGIRINENSEKNKATFGMQKTLYPYRDSSFKVTFKFLYSSTIKIGQ